MKRETLVCARHHKGRMSGMQETTGHVYRTWETPNARLSSQWLPGQAKMEAPFDVQFYPTNPRRVASSSSQIARLLRFYPRTLSSVIISSYKVASYTCAAKLQFYDPGGVASVASSNFGSSPVSCHLVLQPMSGT
jgi:hypothetical protein